MPYLITFPEHENIQSGIDYQQQLNQLYIINMNIFSSLYTIKKTEYQ